MPVWDIEAEHPEYAGHRRLWAHYRDLYAGGARFRANAEHYLVRRQREPNEVYGERLERVFYENYIGSIIDWYAATLFRREPVVGYQGNDDQARAFFNVLTEDCDLRGTSLTGFFRQQFIQALTLGRSYVVADFPRTEFRAGTRAEEEAMGVSRAYLTGFGADDAINWERNSRGELEWIVFRTERLTSDGPGRGPWRREQQWTYYDRERFQVYTSLHEARDKRKPVLADEGQHGMAKLKRVPVFELAVSEGLWLMNKAASLQLEHFNKSNALSWALTMGLFAMPVVYTDREFDQLMGESYYLQLGPQDKFGWTEPQGTVFSIALENLQRLKEEIYRVCYLLVQAGSPQAAGQLQSAASKQRDYAITQEVLRGYGDAVKDVVRRTLENIALAREDRLTVQVTGMDEFEVGDFSGQLAEASQLLGLGMTSPTLRKQVFKKLAFQYLCDARQEVKDQIAQEIDAETA